MITKLAIFFTTDYIAISVSLKVVNVKQRLLIRDGVNILHLKGFMFYCLDEFHCNDGKFWFLACIFQNIGDNTMTSLWSQFLGILNTKKEKLRELRDQLAKKEASGKLPVEDEEGESTDKTESFDEKTEDDEESDEEPPKNLSGTSKDVPASRSRGRKRK